MNFQERKTEIIEIVKEFKKFSGTSFAKSQRMMDELLKVYTMDMYDYKWRRQASEGSSAARGHYYTVPEVKALIQSFNQNFQDKQREFIYKAIRLFDLTNNGTKQIGAIKELFPEDLFNEVWLQYQKDHDIDPRPQAWHPLQNYLIDFADYIAEKTKDFTGREWLAKKINTFLGKNDRGIYVILGNSGIGKTAFLANLIKTQNYIHHFNTRRLGITSQAEYLQNICAQLIIRYDLDYSEFPRNAESNNQFLKKILKEISAKLRVGEICVIAVDALDEAANPFLFLDSLDAGIYFIVTHRPPFSPYFEYPFASVQISQEQAENQEDIDKYLSKKMEQAKVLEYLGEEGISVTWLWSELKRKSEGSFIYLYYVFCEIEAKKAIDLKTLPQGLEAYYEHQWIRMQGNDKQIWYDYKIPVLIVLCVVYAPIPENLIHHFSKSAPAIVRDVLNEWSAFLYKGKNKVYKDNWLYRIHHESLFDFIHDKGQIQSERVKIKEMKKQIADIMLADIGGDEAIGFDPDNPDD